MEKTSQFPIYDAENLADGEPEGLFVLRGLTQALKRQLITRSQEKLIADMTPKDRKERFVSLDSIGKREARGDEYYPLVQSPGELSGLIWYGPKAHEDSDWTFAIRMYEGFAGRGLATPFIASTLEDFRLRHPLVRSVWLSVDRTNSSARHLYDKFNFRSNMNQEDIDREYMTKVFEYGELMPDA